MNTNNTQSNTEQPTLPFSDPPNEPPAIYGLAEIQAENARLKDQLRFRDAHDDLTQRLKTAGARTPKLLFEAAKEALRFSDDGVVQNAAELVEDLKGRFPEQFGQDVSATPHISIDAGSGRPVQPALTREALAKMNPEEIAKLDWADVRRVLSN